MPVFVVVIDGVGGGGGDGGSGGVVECYQISKLFSGGLVGSYLVQKKKKINLLMSVCFVP